MLVKNIDLEITSKCNLNCQMCYRFENTHTFDISDLDLSVFDRVEMEKLTRVDICGNIGDPACHKRLHDFIDMVHKRTVIKISTNGALRSEQWWRDLADKMKKNVRSFVIFALDGLEDTHSIYRVNANFQKLIGNIKAFNSQGGNSEAQFIPFKHNQHQLEDVKALSKELGCKRFITRISSAYNDNLERPVPPKRQKTGNTATAHTKLVNRPVAELKTRHEACLEKKGGKCSCKHISESSVFINWQGDVFPCCHLGSLVFKKYDKVHDVYLKYKDELNLKNNHMRKIVNSNFFKYVEENYNDIPRCQTMCRFHHDDFIKVG